MCKNVIQTWTPQWNNHKTLFTLLQRHADWNGWTEAAPVSTQYYLAYLVVGSRCCDHVMRITVQYGCWNSRHIGRHWQPDRQTVSARGTGRGDTMVSNAGIRYSAGGTSVDNWCPRVYCKNPGPARGSINQLNRLLRVSSAFPDDRYDVLCTSQANVIDVAVYTAKFYRIDYGSST